MFNEYPGGFKIDRAVIFEYQILVFEYHFLIFEYLAIAGFGNENNNSGDNNCAGGIKNNNSGTQMTLIMTDLRGFIPFIQKICENHV